MADVLQFGDPSLLRAARVADVLRGCGQLLASSDGTHDTFQLSSEADRIDVFISHNWATTRLHKFLVLALHFNLVFATKVAFVAVALGGCFTYFATRHGFLHSALEHVPVTCTLTVLVFHAALLFGHEAQAALGLRGKRVFLDKACIHQSDHALKRRGILSLGAFLHRSDSIVVCFSELYLQKLWTVYEFACFLLVHGEACPGSVHIIPTSLPLLGILISLCWYFVGILVTRVVEGFGADHLLVAVVRIVVTFLAEWLCAYCSRAWAWQQREARATFQGFKLANTQCASPPDRALVQANIISLMRRFSHVGVRAPDEEALLAFDEYVRTASARAFVASVGPFGFPYSFFLPLQVVLFAENMETWCMAIAAGKSDYNTPAQCTFYLIARFVTTFATIPLVGAFGMQLARCCPSLRGVAEVAYTGGVAVLVVLAIGVIDPLSGIFLRPWLLDAALVSPRSCAPFLLSSALLFALTAFVYRQPHWKVDAAKGGGVRLQGELDSCPQASVDAAKKGGGSRSEGDLESCPEVPDAQVDIEGVEAAEDRREVEGCKQEANHEGSVTPSLLVATASGLMVQVDVVAL